MAKAHLPPDLKKLRDDSVRATLRKEFLAFFTTMTTAQDDWPAITDQEFVNAIADSMLDMGKKKGKGSAVLQTLVYELQDRLNNDISKGKP